MKTIAHPPDCLIDLALKEKVDGNIEKPLEFSISTEKVVV